ncbi:hypothetical protein EDB84DRAFT_1435099 [Lactarius hengduanensis]|nr:hypothetical protein EDB84DRAFT_1435099 [Lactarius hengduanensis]
MTTGTGTECDDASEADPVKRNELHTSENKGSTRIGPTLWKKSGSVMVNRRLHGGVRWEGTDNEVNATKMSTRGTDREGDARVTSAIERRGAGTTESSEGESLSASLTVLETDKPCDASFKLHGDNLTLLDIVRSQLLAFAFLSACHIAELTEASVADEGLSAILRISQRRRTMWVGQNGVPYYDRSARTLQFAVTELRRKKRGTTLERWVNFCSLRRMIARRDDHTATLSRRLRILLVA